MCDILTVSSAYRYKARFSIPNFAVCGQRNCHGWGLGYFDVEGNAVVRKSSQMAYDHQSDNIDAELLRLAETERSQYFIGHVRLTSCGETCDCNCHPFRIPILGRDWLFAHNGTCQRIMDYKSDEDFRIDATNDSARVAEYLRDRVVALHGNKPTAAVELFRVVSDATLSLVNEYDADNETFNFVLSDGRVLFVFMHHRPFYVLHREKGTADALLITTCGDDDAGGLTDGEYWMKVNDYDRGCGRLVMICDDQILLTEEIARGE